MLGVPLKQYLFIYSQSNSVVFKCLSRNQLKMLMGAKWDLSDPTVWLNMVFSKAHYSTDLVTPATQPFSAADIRKLVSES